MEVESIHNHMLDEVFSCNGVAMCMNVKHAQLPTNALKRFVFTAHREAKCDRIRACRLWLDNMIFKLLIFCLAWNSF